MEIWNNLFEFNIETLKEEFISNNTTIEELLYLKKVIDITINELLDNILINYK